MASNARDSVVVQEPEVVVGDAIETHDGNVRDTPPADLRASIRDAVRSWAPGRKAWDRAQAWMAAHRSVRRRASSAAPPTQTD